MARRLPDRFVPPTPTTLSTRSLLCALTAVLAIATTGCADEGSSNGSGPTPTGSGTSSTTSDKGGSAVDAESVNLRLDPDTNDEYRLIATNGNDETVLVLSPVGEPTREGSSDAVTITYARASRSGGDAERMYDAFAMAAGETRVLARLAFPHRPVTVTYCLEVFQDPGAVGDSDVVRAHGGDDGLEPALACSKATPIT